MTNSNTVVEAPSGHADRLKAFADMLTVTHKQTVDIKEGRKYDKVYFSGKEGVACLFFVDRVTETIYGSKSWAMMNTRRQFGTLKTITTWVWVGKRPVPMEGTQSYTDHIEREKGISSTYSVRGRPKGKKSLTTV